MSGLFGGGGNKSINNTQNALSALAIQTSTQGLPIPIVYGSTRVSANNIGYGDFTPVPHTTTQTSGGGKAGTMTTTNTTWTYTCRVQMGICEGPIAGVGRIWSNKQIADVSQLGFTLFTGTYAQAPWGFLTTNYPIQALSYKGLCYVANSAFNLGSSNYLPNLSFEVAGLLYSGTGVSVTNASFDQGQCNPRIALSNGGRTATVTNSLVKWASVKGNVYKSTGKWKVEITLQNPIQYHVLVGLANAQAPVNDDQYIGIDVNGMSYFGTNFPSGYGWNLGGGNSSTIPALSLFPNGGIVTLLFDGDAQTLIVKINNVQQGLTYNTAVYGTGPSFTFAVSLRADGATPTTVTVNAGQAAFAFSDPGYSAWSGSAAQFDVTPAAVMNDILPNTTYGAMFTKLNAASITDFTNYCVAAGIACSPNYSTQQSAAAIATELAQIGNAAPVWSEGQLKFIPYCDSTIGAYVPNTTIQYQLTDDHFISPPGTDPIKVTRKRQSDAYNQVTIECVDRNNSYSIASVMVQDQAAIDQYGLRPMPPITMHHVTLPSVAMIIAQSILKRSLYFRNMYEFTIGWPFARLEPMDLVGLTDPGLGMLNYPVRILSIDENEEGNLDIQAEDFTAGVSNPQLNYGTQTGSGSTVNTNTLPGNTGAPVIIQPPLSITGAPQIWIGAAAFNLSDAMTPDWGGCEVWMSLDAGVSYQKAGTISAPAVMGVLSAPLASNGTDPDVTNTLSVNLTTSRGALASVPQAQADALVTLCWVDGELLAFETAALTSAYNYNLTYLRRGQLWTNNGAHSAGTTFMKLDSSVLKIDASTMCADVGSTLYFKLLSFNTAGAGLQNLADVTPITYVMQPIGLVVANGVIPNTVQSCQDLYIPANSVFTLAGRMTNHGRITCVGRLRLTN